MDAADAFDPPSAASIGINLAHLLWVRAARSEKTGTCENTQAAVDITRRVNATALAQEVHCGGPGRHPRMEIHRMDAAVERLFRNDSSLVRNESTRNPGTTNRKLADAVEHVAIERIERGIVNIGGRAHPRADCRARQCEWLRPASENASAGRALVNTRSASG